MKYFSAPLNPFRKLASPARGDDASVPGGGESSELRLVERGQLRTVVAAGANFGGEPIEAEQATRELLRLVSDDSDLEEVVIDMSEIKQISTACLNRLIEVNSRARIGGTRLVLTNLDDSQLEVFRITRLDRLFAVTDPATKEAAG